MLPEAYGCVVVNRFGELLDDDADPLDFITEMEMAQEKKKKKKEEEDKKTKKKPGQRESQKDRRLPLASAGPDLVPVRKQQQQQQQQQQQARPGAATEGRAGKEEVQRGIKRAVFGERRTNQDENPQDLAILKPCRNADSDSRPRGGARSMGGRGGYTRNSDNVKTRGKREFDRHSGTGISPEEKRGGRGPWNWGCVEEASSELMEVTSDVSGKSEDVQMPAEEENQNGAQEKDGEMVVQIAVEMSLDEWKALQEMRRPKMEFNIRKAEDKIPSKAKVIHQSKQQEKLRGTMEGIEDDSNFLRKSVNDITSLLDINFGSLGRPSRGGRGRESHSGPTSRPERAKPILEKEIILAPNPDDPEDFPELSAGR